MIEWKWSTGNGYYKSGRPVKDAEQPPNSNSQENYDTRTNAISQSLTDNLFDPHSGIQVDELRGNKREDIDNKMSGRQMIAQCGVNPFLQSSYVNDIVTRDMFLKPINTSKECVKEGEAPKPDYPPNN